MRNEHERRIPVPPQELGPLLDRLGGPRDVMWPSPQWPPMVLDGPVAVGVSGGHAAIRYRVTGYEPGRRVEFTFDPRIGVHGTHVISVEPDEGSGSVLRHVLEGRLTGSMVLVWLLAIRWIHDAVLEDMFDRAEVAAGTGPGRPNRWSAYVRLVRAFTGVRSRETAVPQGGLLAGALPRVDFADAHVIEARPGTPLDPQVWADAIFRDPPAWVVAALGLRQAVVGLAGIARADTSAFDTRARTDDEVLLGTDDGHLDFRATVRREPDRVVFSTVVTLHNRRGRGYFAIVGLVHPVVVRSMLNRAARRLSRSSNTRPAVPATMGA